MGFECVLGDECGTEVCHWLRYQFLPEYGECLSPQNHSLVSGGASGSLWSPAIGIVRNEELLLLAVSYIWDGNLGIYILAVLVVVGKSIVILHIQKEKKTRFDWIHADPVFSRAQVTSYRHSYFICKG
jgi:hypothetical protein